MNEWMQGWKQAGIANFSASCFHYSGTATIFLRFLRFLCIYYQREVALRAGYSNSKN